MFTDDVVRALLAVRRQVAVGEVVAGQALVVGNPSSFENRETDARKSTPVDVVGSSTGGNADRIVVRKFDVRALLIPDVVELVVHHCQHLGHRVIRKRPSSTSTWVVGAGGNFTNTKKLVDSMRKL